MKVELMREVLRLLDCYYEDMRYHAHISNVDGVNAVTNGTPEFDSEEELQDYLADVHNTIGEVLQEIRDEDTELELDKQFLNVCKQMLNEQENKDE